MTSGMVRTLNGDKSFKTSEFGINAWACQLNFSDVFDLPGERKTNDQSEQRAISRANLGVEESNFDSMRF